MQLSVWWTFLFAVFAPLAHPTNGVTLKALNEVKDGLNVTLQCESNAEELTFIFLNFTDFATIKIGECKFGKHQHCVLYEEDYLAWFDIKMTGSAGELTLVNLTLDHYGIYTCFETYKPNNNDTIEVNGTATLKQSESSNTRVVIIGCAVGGGTLLLLCVIVAICVWKKCNKSGVCCACRTAGESDSRTIGQKSRATQNGSHEPNRITHADIELSLLNQTTDPLMGTCSRETIYENERPSTIRRLKSLRNRVDMVQEIIGH